MHLRNLGAGGGEGVYPDEESSKSRRRVSELEILTSDSAPLRGTTVLTFDEHFRDIARVGSLILVRSDE